MDVHEYQAKELLSQYGVPVPRGGVAYSVHEAIAVASGLIGENKALRLVVKAQIHAGGRGKGGGVKVVDSLAGVEAEASRMLGMTLVTHQTGPAGRLVGKVYVEEGCSVKRELYLGMLVDRACGLVTVIASTEGGVEIEDVAANSPEKIIKVQVDPVAGLQPYHARRIAFGLGLKDKQIGRCVNFLHSMYSAFTDLDCSIIEVNPLAITDADTLIALDCKVVFDDNALFRHQEIAAMKDEAEEDPAEALAERSGLNYVKLDGNIGCMVNGAGLAMATMDIVKLYGGSPANFLDVGGGATKDRVATAFKIILSDKNVKGIFVNIFGGIMRCDIISEGIIAAAKEVRLQVPLVVRLEGTNVELGKKILAGSGLPILAGDNLADGAEKIVKAVSCG